MSLNIIYKDKDVTPTNIPVTWPWRLPLPYWISTSQTWTSQLRSSARLIEMQLPLQSCTCSRPQHALPGAPDPNRVLPGSPIWGLKRYRRYIGHKKKGEVVSNNREIPFLTASFAGLRGCLSSSTIKLAVPGMIGKVRIHCCYIKNEHGE